MCYALCNTHYPYPIPVSANDSGESGSVGVLVGSVDSVQGSGIVHTSGKFPAAEEVLWIAALLLAAHLVVVRR